MAQDSLKMWYGKQKDGTHHWMYLAYCDKCDIQKQVNAFIPPEVDATALEIGDELGKCDCGGTLFHGVNKNTMSHENDVISSRITMGRRMDPSSSSFWKNGKTVGEVAKILQDKNAVPY